MSDKWMEMKQPMLLMQSHNINIISWCSLVVPYKNFHAQTNLEERDKQNFIMLPLASVLEEQNSHKWIDEQQKSKASSREKYQ